MSITDKVRYIRITDKVRYTRNTDFVYNGHKTLVPTGTLYARFTVYTYCNEKYFRWENYNANLIPRRNNILYLAALSSVCVCVCVCVMLRIILFGREERGTGCRV